MVVLYRLDWNNTMKFSMAPAQGWHAKITNIWATSADWSMTVFKISIDRSMTIWTIWQFWQYWQFWQFWKFWQFRQFWSMTNFSQHAVEGCTFRKLSLTIFKQASEIVIDWSMTIFSDTLLRGAPLGNRHWPVNDNFWAGIRNCHWLVNDNFLPTRCWGVHL